MKIVEIVEHREVVPGYNLMVLDAPDVALNARPGQFLHIRCSDTMDPLLRRPLSIHAVNGERYVSILYHKAGRGTKRMEQLKEADIMGPLGRGFSIPSPGSKVVVVGGGIGVAPLYFLLQELSRSGIRVSVFIGAVNSAGLLVTEKIKSLGHELHLATEDGSAGYHGMVTSACMSYLTAEAIVYACGPQLMLKTLAGYMEKYGVSGEFSLEEKMGCGIGACLSCACKTRLKGGGGYKYSRVCLEGPVFSVEEVAWE